MLSLLFALAIVSLVYYNCVHKRRNYPPGPMPLPFVGNLLTIKRDPYEAFKMWRKRYGPVFTYWMAETPVVALTDYPTLQETLIRDSDNFSGRFGLGKLSLLARGGHFGVVETEGDLWREQVGGHGWNIRLYMSLQRRFALSILRDMGMSKNLMQKRIITEFDGLVEELEDERRAHDEVDLGSLLQRTAGNTISLILFNTRFTKQSYIRYRSLVDAMSGNVFGPLMRMTVTLPGSEKLPVLSQRFHHALAHAEQMRNYFDREIEEHKRQIESGEIVDEESYDFVHKYIIEMNKHESEETNFNLNNLRAIIFDLYLAGQETTGHTFLAHILHLLNHPEALSRIYQELDEKIGGDRLIEWQDRASLVWFNATINETQRLFNLLPNNLFHKNLRATTVNGHHIPQNTCIQPQIATVMYDETVFAQPYAYKPERFIDLKTGELRKIEELCPFGIGKRQCMGESLARMEMFLILSNLLNQYRIEAIDSKHPPTMVKTFGFGARCQDFKVRLSKRH